MSEISKIFQFKQFKEDFFMMDLKTNDDFQQLPSFLG